MLDAGTLRHKVTIQQLVDIADSSGEVQDSNGDPVQEWVDVATVWAAIEPVSGREFIAAQAEQSKVVARVVIRYRNDIDSAMRLFHPYKQFYYNIEAILPDKESGLEYLTVLVSEGIRFTENES